MHTYTHTHHITNGIIDVVVVSWCHGKRLRPNVFWNINGKQYTSQLTQSNNSIGIFQKIVTFLYH